MGTRRTDIDARQTEILAAVAQGRTMDEIAALVGVTRMTILRRLRTWGVERQPIVRCGPEHHSWKDGRHHEPYGYVKVRTGDGRRIREHRLVAEQMLGRPLAPGEVVHHKNGNRQDNRPENLQVFASNGEHLRHELTGRKRS